METISEELRLKDIEFMKKRLDDLEKSMKRSNDKQLKIEHELCERVIAHLEEGKDVRLGDWKAADIEILNTFQLLSAKSVVYLESSEKNKQNRRKVKYHQATGSRSYVAHLHAYKKKENNAKPSTEQNEELDLVEAFKTCHTSSKNGLSEPATEALSNMEALRAEPIAEGETAVSSVQVVSQVLSQNSSNHFLKSVGIKLVASSKSSSSNESELQEELAAEAKAAVQGEIDDLKKRSEEAEEKLARTQKKMEEYKKLTEINTKAMEENNALLKRILAINNGSST